MQTELLNARLQDTVKNCEKTSSLKFLGFLSEEQAVWVSKQLSNKKAKYKFSGGYEGAQRVFLCCFPEEYSDLNIKFPIEAVTVSFRKTERLSHGDFLGTLMSLGLKRETIGDILIEQGRAVIFLTSEICNFVLTQLSKVGSVGVSATKGITGTLPQRNQFKEFAGTVSSERLDCVIAEIISVSRNTASQKIKEGAVSVNSLVSQKTTKQVFEGDIISVRQSGKFVIDSLCDRTKKDRIVLKYRKYI